ncbi:hypothetical protein Ddye_007256 [Dipteronia dyeriana]|uniref:Uncharacterized protein n=1 Tax=Dipteronia dyeriana TaxID=168575 RepID=A0AAD9XK11_9ROSI|nr:hypothetical protein Ddye_007256 [Dipteronia dyeriana]
MVATRRSEVSSERQKWDKIFDGLVKMLKSQQEQLETLLTERKFLGDRIKMQQEKWVSDVRLYEDQISQMKSSMEAQEMMRFLEAAKSDMVVGLKQREASFLKLKLENTGDELADFRAWFDLLKNNPTFLQASGSKPIGSKMIEGDVKRLKLEYDKLALEKRKEVSSLLVEKEFVWHQFKLMESELTNKLNSKRAEVDQANENIANLLASTEQLQSSNNEKDKCIASLKTNISEMEAGAGKLNDKISKLSRELELLRKSRNGSVTPMLNRCTAGGRTSNLQGKNGARNEKSESASVTPVAAGDRILKTNNSILKGSNVVVKKELPAQVPDLVETKKGSRSSKRKVADAIIFPDDDTPKLFTSQFKVPKLKSSICPT